MGQATTADVIIAGGGLHGLSAALHLAQAGFQVVLLEKDRVGRHASGANAGGVRRLGRALPEIPLADAALAQWHRIEELVGDRCGFSESSQIKVAETQEDLHALEARCQMVREVGFDHEQIIGQNALFDLLPDVAKHCVGGVVVKGDGHADPFATVRAFDRRARELGVRVVEGSAVRSVAREAGQWRVKTDDRHYVAPGS